MKELTAHLTPRCIGRYLIDMPADAHVFQSLRVKGVEIDAQPMTIDEYRRTMQERSNELSEAKSHFGYRYLYADRAIEGIPDSRYFISLGSILKVLTACGSLKRIDGIGGIGSRCRSRRRMQRIRSISRTHSDAREASYMNTLSVRSQLVTSMLSRARGRTDDEIPTEPGVCFQGGFLQGKALDQENTKTKFVLDSHRDVNVNIDTDSNIRSSDSLLQRGAEIKEALSRNSGRTLRNGVVALQGLTAEEWLMAGTTTADVPGFHFALEANAPIGSPQSPLVNLVLDVGAPNLLLKAHEISRASLTEGESVALWDKVMPTLRPRPNGF
ncbi:T6SS immunity protein Tli4 family protein [Cupriavidus basilensis]